MQWEDKTLSMVLRLLPPEVYACFFLAIECFSCYCKSLDFYFFFNAL
ncbi:hypothetical protein I3760_05G117800 [Carya illinoinensis]|nr:hypothetical protein I3760_05G117800 [Carya illinoinensis]